MGGAVPWLGPGLYRSRERVLSSLKHVSILTVAVTWPISALTSFPAVMACALSCEPKQTFSLSIAFARMFDHSNGKRY